MQSRLGAGTGWVWTRAQARAAGLSDATITRRVATGQWLQLQRAVFTDGGGPPSPVLRGWAAVVACGGPGRAWAAGRTTARLYGLPLVDDDDPATGACDRVHDDVAIRTGRGGRRGALHVGRAGLGPGDTVLVDGCPSLTLARALPGLAGVLAPEALVCVLDAALHRELLTTGALEDVVRRSAGGRGAAVLRRAATLADGRAESPHETLLRLLLKPVLPRLEPQVRLRDGRGRLLARLDLGDEVLRLAVEGDGKRGHAGETMVAKDRRRDGRAERLGWLTERFTWYDTRCRPDEVVHRVLARADARGSRS